MSDSDNKNKPRGLYRSPPAEFRFVKGTSGNPKGRRRKERALTAPNARKHLNLCFDSQINDLINQEAYRTITIREGGRTEKLSVIQAVLRKLGLSALNGNVRAQRTLLEYITFNESVRSNASAEILSAAVEYKENWAATFAECDRRGVDRPNPVPHPDDVIIDRKTGAISIDGPVLTQQVNAQQAALDMKETLEHSLDLASSALKNDPSNPEIIETHKELTQLVDWIRRGAPYTG